MKKLIIFSCVLVIASPVYAESWRTACTNAAGLAETIMRNRQQGVAMDKMINALSEIELVSEEMSTLIEDLIINAYGSPRYSADQNQRESIEDYRNLVYLACVKRFRE